MLVKKYYTYLKLEKGLSKNSIEAYLQDLQRLQDYMTIHDIDIVRATLDDLQAFIFETSKKIASVRTQARLIAGIHFIVFYYTTTT